MSRRNRSYSRSPARRGGGRDGIKDLSPVEWRRFKLVEHVKERYREKSAARDRNPKEIKAFLEKNQISVIGKNCPNPILDFTETPFESEILLEIRSNDWEKPTPIQSVAWPLCLAGCDVVGIARTGGGKTAAFLLPALHHILLQPKMVKGDGPICLVLVPTRELALQVNEVCTDFCDPLKIRNAAIYGGARRKSQNDELRRYPDILVATPGRLMDFLKSKDTNLRRCTYLVLDEADRMLDMGFEPSIRAIMSQIRPDHQTVMFSATWPKGVEKLARSFMLNPYHIKIGSHDLHANKNIKQNLEFLNSEKDKFSRLKEIIKLHKKQKGIVFVETKKRCDQLAYDLQDRGFDVAPMHGDKAQSEREDLLRRFRSGRIYVLVATDVASRGLDIDDIAYVVNYDFPNQTEDYVHRIGRTARSDNKGTAYTFLGNLMPRKAKELLYLMEDSEQDVPNTLYQMAGMRRRRSVTTSSKTVSSSSRSSSGRRRPAVQRRKRSSSSSSQGSIESKSSHQNGFVKRSQSCSTKASVVSEKEVKVEPATPKEKRSESPAPRKRHRSHSTEVKKSNKRSRGSRSASVDEGLKKRKKAKKEHKKKSKKSKKSKKHRRHSSTSSSK